MPDLPDEIISEILSPALTVSDDAFSSTATISPFFSRSESSSSFLLVNKAWLRVATPLLYNVVILRSKAQAKALAVALMSNPAFGSFIRKLRVEGGFAISLHKILQTSTNLTDLFITLDIARPDNACGLCRGLLSINPVRVILSGEDNYRQLSIEAEALLGKLEECIRSWTKMAVFEMDFSRLSWSARATLSSALCRAPNLTTLVASASSHHSIVGYNSIQTIATNPSLKRIIIKGQDSMGLNARQYIVAQVQHDQRLKALLNFPDDWALDDTVPFVYPARLAGNPVQEDAIWNRVLYFALCRFPSKLGTRPDKVPVLRSRFDYMAPLLVCKKFAVSPPIIYAQPLIPAQRLGLPHLCTNPTLNRAVALRSFANRLSKQPSLGLHVRSLAATVASSEDLYRFQAITSKTPGLLELRGNEQFLPISWASFNIMGNYFGATLTTFHGVPVAESPQPASPAVFNLFPRMRSFAWDSITTFQTQPELIPIGTFDNLVHLTIDYFHSSFFDVMSHMELPSLRTTTFSAEAEGGFPFFQKHGKKLQQLAVSSLQLADPELVIFASCPSITVLGISCRPKTVVDASSFTPPDKHASLEHIVFRVDPYGMKPAHRTSLGRFFSSLDTTPFPALRGMEHSECIWPTNDREISKSYWVKWAESLLDRDVQLVDPEGVPWRPRLKYIPESK
ncbi:hypothetical protein B0H16DRAFT_1435576 [Mycena metata]|uniref:Uncharacterized protein n=1 Tax=Mycena metata TaxID=1033252 RepID=A0AAD7H822_9AGAR|nr:hypothetical protein B0H16DRAFT_1435576 [Mycena metata]